MNKKILRSLSVVALGLVLVACDGGQTSENNTKADYTLKVGSYVKLDTAKNQIELSTATVVLKGDKIASAYFDVLQAPFVITEGTIAIDTTKNQTKDAGEKNIETKQELKERYGMSSAEQGEWYVQAAKFADYSINKTITEVVSANYKNHYNENGTTEVAGCTISQGNFVNALKNITDSKNFKADTNTVSAGVGTIVSTLADNVLTVTLAGSATNASGKVFETSINAYQIPLMVDASDATKITYNREGKAQTTLANFEGHTTKDGENYITEVLSKRELKDLYGMSSAEQGEWYVQANNFATYAKKADKASDLVGQNYKTHYNENGTVEVSGCTISMGDFAAAVSESATLKSASKAK